VIGSEYQGTLAPGIVRRNESANVKNPREEYCSRGLRHMF